MKTRLGWIDVVAYLAYLAIAALTLVSGARGALWYAGIGLSAVCAVLWFVARWQLGPAFAVGAQARRLVTGGLYTRLRHPIYVFGTLAFLCAVLALKGWSALVIWLVVIVIQVVRARREDQILAEAFGAEYAAYRSRTWF